MDAVEVVRLVNLKNIGRVIVLLVYCFYRLKYSFLIKAWLRPY